MTTQEIAAWTERSRKSSTRDDSIRTHDMPRKVVARPLNTTGDNRDNTADMLNSIADIFSA